MSANLLETLPASTLSLAQHRDSLWADPGHHVYALMLAMKLPGLRERLSAGGVEDWDGLWTGDLEPEERAAAPVVATLRRTSAFTDWLLGEAAQSSPRWGALALSRLPFLAMRLHARALCKGQLPNGQTIRIDWMDPDVMEALLPVAAPDQAQRVYAGFETLVTVEPTQWTRWSLDASRLVRRVSAVA